MQENLKIGSPTRKAEVFKGPNKFDLINISVFFDDSEMVPPPKTYILATNPEQQLRTVTDDLIDAFDEHLLFVGLTGSRAVYPDRHDADLDVIAVVDDDAPDRDLIFEGDLKIVSYTGLREYIECGFQIVSSQFRKARPIHEREGAVAALRSLKPVLEKAVPFLSTKSKFDEQTADVYRLVSARHRAISLYEMGFQEEAFSQLDGVEHDDLLRSLQESPEAGNSGIHELLARHYANLGLNKLFQSLTEMAQALHIKETGDIREVDQLGDWLWQRAGGAGALLNYIHGKRIACYKKGALLLDAEYDMMRKGIREKKKFLKEKMAGGEQNENRKNKQSAKEIPN